MTTYKKYVFHDVGFHGDEYLIEIVQNVMRQSTYFIETGANVGTTLAYVSKINPEIHCLSCEPDNDAYFRALTNTKGLNVELYNETSQDFMERLTRQYSLIFSENVVFWLDAHGYGYEWPLRKEIKFISEHFEKAYIFIDDFKVPGLDCFGFDSYNGQECSYEYIKDYLSSIHSYNLYYPNYTDKTSTHHPLRGWCLIEFGHDASLNVPDGLDKKTNHISIN